MRQRLLTVFALLCVAFAFSASTMQAQSLRPTDTFFIKPKVGIAYYLGDNEQSPFNFNFDAYEIDGKLPYSVAGELGYQFSVPFSVSAAFQYGNYPVITQFGEQTSGSIEDDATTRSSVQLFATLKAANARTRVAPYVHLGANYSFGDVTQQGGGEESESSFGPLVGIGLDFAINDRTSFFIEHMSSFTLDDEAMDANDGTGDGEGMFEGGFGGTDMLNALTLGLTINFKSAFTPVEVLSIDCPQTLVTGEEGAFSAMVNDDASVPLEYRWDFGDGATADAIAGSHSYAQDGTYTVTFTATNEGSTDTETCSVRVIAAAEIVTVTADPTTTDTCEPMTPVQFSANVRGTAPIDYSWDFGDGSTGTGATPSHTYSQPGTYTVMLTARNEAGSDTREMTVTVEPCPVNCDIEEMNSVFFDRNSSVLTEQGRQLLMENVQLFEDCPNLCAQVVGYAAANERNASSLAADRARAVEQFYMDNGLAASRFTTSSEVQRTGKKDASQVRRVDTLPMECANGDMDGDM
jgi:outer membrane protein OmpA-like peptidoglycan-associated protein